jgi:uncharacterized membrane protein
VGFFVPEKGRARFFFRSALPLFLCTMAAVFLQQQKEKTMILEFVFRWAHVLFGIVWIGMLYYFNFVQTEYFKEAEASAKADAIKKLAPRALWWFRWGAMFTFLTGLVLLHLIGATTNFMGMPLITMGALAGTIMFLNVWLIIWPNQQVVLG